MCMDNVTLNSTEARFCCCYLPPTAPVCPAHRVISAFRFADQESAKTQPTSAVIDKTVGSVNDISSQKRHRKRFRCDAALPGVLLFIFLLASLAGICSAEASPDPNPKLPAPKAPINRRILIKNDKREDVVCQTIDIRNTVANFKQLENCTVIEGFLAILLIDNEKPKEFENLTFPKLREITHYLLLYRVFGIRSLKNMFPNLTVIRGLELMHNYALVVYEMRSLQEIGFGSLTNIIRGSVRIEKNPNLCYVETVNWNRILSESWRGPKNRFIKDNKPSNECPNSCDKCPEVNSGDSDPVKVRRCWTNDTCQKLCDRCGKEGIACDPGTGCCNEECLGGCSVVPKTFDRGHGNDCMACRNVLYNGRCYDSCPVSTYEFQGWRCVTQLECENMTHQQSYMSPDGTTVKYWKAFQTSQSAWAGKCDFKCPAGYMENTSKRSTCIPCPKGSCPKECKGKLVDSVAAAQYFHGCTKVIGSLQIQISGGKNIILELEKNLGMIEEVTEFLKVVRSFPLISLSFLSRLRKIGGQKLNDQGPVDYALYVLDNQNLEHLWNWTVHPKLEIGAGKVFFHFNPKLCRKHIDTMITHLTGNLTFNVTSPDERDISKTSNGDKVACEEKLLSAKVTNVTYYAAKIEFDNFKRHLNDERSLLGYIISWKEAMTDIANIYDGRDACGTDSWRVNDVPAMASSRNVFYEHALIPDLKPFTRYAVYVKTYTVAKESEGAQSDIIYFTTHPTNPSEVQNLKAWSNSSSELIIRWNAPAEPNGIVTRYYVIGAYVIEGQSVIDQRNYCTEPAHHEVPSRVQVPPKVTPKPGSKPTASPDAEECCTCSADSKPAKQDSGKSEKPKPDDETERTNQIEFENILHNLVYIKKEGPTRAKRSVMSGTVAQDRNSNQIPYVGANRTLDNSSIGHLFPNDVIGTNTHHWSGSPLTSPLLTLNESGANGTDIDGLAYAFKNVTHATEIVIKSLKHYSGYTIEVRACHDPVKDRPELCSRYTIVTARTAAMPGADDIEQKTCSIEVLNNTSGTALLKFDDPRDPNGAVLNYQIEYKREDISNSKYTPICLTHREFMETKAKQGYKLSGLTHGNYSIRIRTNSLAGFGNWTKPLYFQIAEETGWSTLHLLIVVVIVIIICAVLALGAIFVVKRKQQGLPDGILYASVNPEYMSSADMYVPDDWEVLREKIDILKELGKGSFGMVYEGIVKDLKPELPISRCAIKTVNDQATMRERIEFLHEASVMKAFKCHHVVRLLGVVSKGQPTLVIMELMANGDLKSYLRSHRPGEDNFTNSQPPTLKQTLQMASEIADGMAYLSAKKFVHRDLAARNCMVSHDCTVKIGDFGMTRDIYETDYYRKGGKGWLPVRWMAPESLKDGVFTWHSDVWSYGVVLWEMATLACQPYQGLSNEEVLKYVMNGGIMELPENCPDKLYNLMRLCWHHHTRHRPSFLQLIELLLPDISDSFQQNSFYYSAENTGLSGGRGNGPDQQVDDSLIDIEADGEGDVIGVEIIEDGDRVTKRFVNGGKCAPLVSSIVDDDDLEDVGPTTPLRKVERCQGGCGSSSNCDDGDQSDVNSCSGDSDINDEKSFNFPSPFRPIGVTTNNPGRTAAATSPPANDHAGTTGNDSAHVVIDDGGSQSAPSDGSKGSKISNGSIGNGQITTSSRA